VERAELDQLERVVHHEIKARFPCDTVRRVVVLQHGDEPAIEAGALLVRVFIPAPDGPEDYAAVLAGWAEAHRRGWSSSGGNSPCGSLRPGCSSSPLTTPAPALPATGQD
jgi:hypothetical protein